MSKRRHMPGVPSQKWGVPDRNEAGKPICRWCRQEIPEKCRRRCYCSQKCVDEFLVRVNAGHARRLVKRRDKGICAGCGCDCIWLTILRKEWWWALRESVPNYTDQSDQAKRHRKAIERIKRLGNWQADHIKPVIEGGGECGLENLRTLCHDCHAIATKKLAERRAEERRAAKAALFVTGEIT